MLFTLIGPESASVKTMTAPLFGRYRVFYLGSSNRYSSSTTNLPAFTSIPEMNTRTYLAYDNGVSSVPAGVSREGLQLTGRFTTQVIAPWDMGEMTFNGTFTISDTAITQFNRYSLHYFDIYKIS